MFFMTHLAIYLSKKFNFYDIPTQRNTHKLPTPILGGFALITSIIINILIVSPWVISPFTIGLFGAIIIFLIGIFDDKFKMSPFIKLSFQIGLVSFLFFNVAIILPDDHCCYRP